MVRLGPGADGEITVQLAPSASNPLMDVLHRSDDSKIDWLRFCLKRSLSYFIERLNHGVVVDGNRDIAWAANQASAHSCNAG